MTALAYNHWQSGTVLRIGLGLGFAVMLAAGWTAPPMLPVMIACAVLMISLLFLMHGLGVEVGQETIQIWFGPGLIRKSISLEEVAECRPVRNHWLMGWGVRYIGGGWMWNVSGLDAVELRLKDGKLFRIGTDDSQGLSQAIRARLS
jgi:hypothetical protein